MKNLIQQLYHDSRHNLRDMKLSEMKLSERIKYEKAMIQLEMMKTLIDKCNVTLNQP